MEFPYNQNSLRFHFVRVLLAGKRELTAEEMSDRAGKLGLQWISPPLLVAEIAPYFTGNREKNVVRICQFVQTFLDRRECKAICVLNEYDNIQVLLHTDSDVKIENVDLLFAELRKSLIDEYRCEIFIGIGRLTNSLTAVAGSAVDARQMLAYRFQYAEKGIINIANIIHFQSNNQYGTETAISRVIGCFLDGNLGKMSTRLDELVQSVRRRPNASQTSVKRTLIELVVRILNTASDAYGDVDVVLNDRDPYRWILSQNRIETITDWIMELSTQLLQMMNAQIKQKERDVIGIAYRFIEDNLQNPNLCLQSVSEAAGLSKNYFCEFFKKEAGMGLNSYIVGRRIEKAKAILRTTPISNKNTAILSGFSSASYFNRVFKEAVGMTPTEYRRSNRTDTLPEESTTF